MRPPGLRGAPARPLEVSDSVEAQIKAEKLRQAQLMTSRLEEEDRLRRGVYVEAKTVRNEMVRLAADLLGSFEGSLTDLSAALAAQFHLPGRDVLHVLRREFRRIRERLSAAHAASAAAEPRTIQAVENEAGSIQEAPGKQQSQHTLVPKHRPEHSADAVPRGSSRRFIVGGTQEGRRTARKL